MFRECVDYMRVAMTVARHFCLVRVLAPSVSCIAETNGTHARRVQAVR
jgi:hypothetical protein